MACYAVIHAAIHALLVAITSVSGKPHTRRVMNDGGIPYAISNPPSSTPNWRGRAGSYSTNFLENVDGPVEYFDVYGEVRTKYSQVYWTRNAPVNLPPELVKRFDGKVMAITGYEADQVVHSGPQLGSTTSGDTLGGFACYPECGESDRSIPSYFAYNHHYFGWIKGKDAVMHEADQFINAPQPTKTSFRSLPHDHHFPTSIDYQNNPGGEYRKSYHGYPSGYAQLIHSPQQWIVNPMQIDTHNRKYNLTDQVSAEFGFLPKMDYDHRTDFETGLNPLIECPCSTRISRSKVTESSVLTSGVCSASISSASECAAAINAFAHASSISSITNATLPSGCLMFPESKPHSYRAVFNSAGSSETCEVKGLDVQLQGVANLGNLVNMTISLEGKVAKITMSGPDDVWFGAGFDATTMSDQPYAIIVEGDGEVSEHKLGPQAPGHLLRTSITVVSSEVVSGIRTVTLVRPVAGVTKEHFSLPTQPGELKMITAVGSGPKFAYHKARTGAQIMLLPSNSQACVCKPKVSNYMSYMNKSSREFEGYPCQDRPRSDMASHGDGTGRNVQNAACSGETYHGGLVCCQHTWFLTDLEQDGSIPEEVDTYFMKWRYYFQEYRPANLTLAASHQNLENWWFLIDEAINDYEEDNAHYGRKSIGRITANLTVRDLHAGDSSGDSGASEPIDSPIKIMVATPHCHAPSCLYEELWNADTNELLCNATTSYGSPDHGQTHEVFNERGYLAIHPCIFGYQPGLQEPFTLTLETKLRAVKVFNNTYRHLGQMAQWTGFFVREPKDAFYV